MTEWLQFAQQHWIFGGILASLLWFLAGRQSLSNRQPRYAVFWQGIALFIALVLCVWAVVERGWIGLAFGLFVLLIEAFLMKQTLAKRSDQRQAFPPSRL
jgi:cytochrome oxidase assembly protein ShyY1